MRACVRVCALTYIKYNSLPAGKLFMHFCRLLISCYQSYFFFNINSSIGATLAFLTSLPVQDGGPHDFRSKMAAPRLPVQDDSIGVTLASMTSLPIQDGGPHDTKMAAPTKSRWRPPVTRSVTPGRVSQRPRPREGSVTS